MSNDVAHVNYVKRGLKDSQVVTLELFGSPIDCVNGMMKLNDIRKAYLANIEAEDRTNLKRIDKWAENSSTKELSEYLEESGEEFGYSSYDQIHMTVEGKGGGTYVCRELAHSFAMWLDARYAVHVLRAFDLLVQGEFGEAHRTATKVAKPFIRLEWEARAERLTSLDMDPIEHFQYLVEDIYHEVTESLLVNPVKLRDFIYDNIGENLILERMLNSLEILWRVADAEEAVTLTVEHFEEDPGFAAFTDILKDYDDNHNTAG